MFNKLFILLIIILLHSSLIFGQSVFKDFTKSKWIGEGTLMKVPTIFNMDWNLVLDNQFYELRFSSISKEKHEKNFEAIAFYKLSDSVTVTGSWFDIRGTILPLKGKIHENQLIINWGNKKTEQGRTIYSLIGTDSMNVKDYILQDDEYILFGEANYKSK